MTPPRNASLADAFERALGEILARVSVLTAAYRPDAMPASIAVAYSGGLDSSALLRLAHDYAKARGIALHAFHVHHGISPNADDWLEHCECECANLGIALDVRRITLREGAGGGIEQAARLGRYAALGELCRLHRVPLLLTAHHLDDQAETVLLQLLRGAGMAGLSGMERINRASDLLGGEFPLLGRPLLDVARAELEDFVAARGIACVEDESNADPRYVRNALRHRVMPALIASFPDCQRRLARSARHAQSAQRLLDALAAQDFAACRDGERIDVARLKRLDNERIDNLLRYWLARHGMRMPATAWLEQMRVQLLTAREDAQVRITHADGEIRRHRGRIFLTPRRADPAAPPLAFRWDGEAAIDFPAFGGCLHFEPAEQGVDGEWLRAQDLTIHYRSGGEEVKPAPNRPTRSLKHHYQSLDIPAWERLRLPLVDTAQGLLFAAGIGMNWRHPALGGGRRIRLRWEADPADDFSDVSRSGSAAV